MTDSSTTADTGEDTPATAKKSTKKAKKKASKKKSTKKKAAKKKTKKKGKKKGKKRRTKKEKLEAEARTNAIAEALHSIVREAAPDLQPTVQWDHDYYKGKDLVVGVAKHDGHANLVVYNGEAVSDSQGVLRGVGYNRSFKAMSVDGIPREALVEIVRSSARADAEKTPEDLEKSPTA